MALVVGPWYTTLSMCVVGRQAVLRSDVSLKERAGRTVDRSEAAAASVPASRQQAERVEHEEDGRGRLVHRRHNGVALLSQAAQQLCHRKRRLAVQAAE